MASTRASDAEQPLAHSVCWLRHRGDNALEIAVAFSTTEDKSASVTSDLIKTMHTALETQPGAPAAQRARRYVLGRHRNPQTYLNKLTTAR